MVLDQAGVGTLSGPQHGDPFEGHTRPGSVDHEPCGLAYLLVGIGGRHDRRWPGLGSIGRVVGGHRRAEGIDEIAAVGVGSRFAGELRHDADVDPGAECADECDRTSGQLQREVQHQAA